MGVLKDAQYWTGILNEISALNPRIGQDISAANADAIRQLACRAFKKLLDDPDFEQDLGEAIAAARDAAPALASPRHPNFHHFVDLFMELEAKILRDAGLNKKAVGELDRELRSALREPEPDRLEGLADKIRYCRKLACDPTIPEDPKKTPLWKVAMQAVKGVGVIGADVGVAAGAAVTLGPAGAAAVGTVAGISAGAGASMIGKAIKGRW